MTLQAFSGLVAACVLAVIALSTLNAGWRRSANQLFALFLLLVAGNFTSNFLSEYFAWVVHDERLAVLFGRMAVAFLALDPAILLYFAATSGGRARRSPSNAAIAALFATPVILVASLPFQSQQLLEASASPFRLLLIGQLAVAYLLALGLIVTAWLREDDPGRRGVRGLMVIAFSTAIIPRIAVVRTDLGADFRGDFGIFAISALLYALVFCSAYLLRPDRRREVARVAAASGIIVGLVVATWAPLVLAPAGVAVPVHAFYTLRWIVFGVIVSYAILRYQVFDIDLRLRRGASVGLAAALVVAAFLGAREVARLVLPGALPPLPEVVGVFAAVAMVVPAGRAAKSGSTRLLPGASPTEEFLHRRKLEVYAAALTSALEEGRVPEDDADAQRLRRELALSDDDHREILALARAQQRFGADLSAAVRKGAVLQGRYVVGDQIGSGRHGRTYRARDRGTGGEVVLKELRPEWRADERALRRFRREAALLQTIAHPNVVRILDHFESVGTPFLVLEYEPGGSLDQRLGREALERREALSIARDILQGLAALHAAGIVHRDVKPGNVLFAADGTAKVADLGIAHVESSEPLTLATLEGSQPGTLRYMSPEQARGAPVDARSDVYAVGALLYEMLAGRPPFDVEGLSDFEARKQLQRRRKPPPIPRAPQALQQAIARSLESDPPGVTRARRSSSRRWSARLPRRAGPRRAGAR